MSRRNSERRTIMQRIGAAFDNIVFAIDPVAGNQRWSARVRRELAEKSIDRYKTRYSSGEDREGGNSGGGGFRSARSNSPDQRNFLRSVLSPDSALETDRDEMIVNVDSAFKNYELATAHVEGRVIRVAGCGLTLDPDIDFEAVGRDEETVDEWNKQLRTNWERTACDIGKRGESSWEIQHLCARYYERRREWFLLIGDQADPMAPTTLKVEVLHPDRVKTPPSIGAVTNGAEAPWINWLHVRMGMQLDRDGNVVGCYVQDTHPGDDKLWKQTYTYYPMKFPNGLPRVIHHFERVDEGQHRGYPRMQVGNKRLHAMEEFDEAERERNYVGSCLAAIVRTDLPVNDAMNAHGVVEDATGKRQRDIVPGMFHYVGESDNVETLDPTGAPNSFAAYMEYEGRMYAAGAGSPYEMLTGKWGGLAYNAAKIIWNMDEATVDVLQKGHAKTWRLIYAHYVMRMVVTGQIDIDQNEFRSQPWLFTSARVIAPPRASIDPSREDRNDMVLIEGNVQPHSDMVERKTGEPASSVYRRIARNRAEMQEWGLNTTMPAMGRDGVETGTQIGDTNQASSDANSEPTDEPVESETVPT